MRSDQIPTDENAIANSIALECYAFYKRNDNYIDAVKVKNIIASCISKEKLTPELIKLIEKRFCELAPLQTQPNKNLSFSSDYTESPIIRGSVVFLMPASEQSLRILTDDIARRTMSVIMEIPIHVVRFMSAIDAEIVKINKTHNKSTSLRDQKITSLNELKSELVSSKGQMPLEIINNWKTSRSSNDIASNYELICTNNNTGFLSSLFNSNNQDFIDKFISAVANQNKM